MNWVDQEPRDMSPRARLAPYPKPPYLPRSNFLPSGSMSFTSKISSNRMPAMVKGPQE